MSIKPAVGWAAIAATLLTSLFLFVRKDKPRFQAPSQSIVLARLAEGVPAHPTRFYVAPDASCSDERYQLAFNRWEEAGWPKLELTRKPEWDAVHVRNESILDSARDDHELRGAVGVACVRRDNWFDEDCVLVMAVREGACGVDDYAIEHEVGHAAYALAHVNWPEGWVMNKWAHDIGPRIPAPSEGVWNRSEVYVEWKVID